MMRAVQTIFVFSALVLVLLSQACGRKSNGLAQRNSSSQPKESAPARERSAAAIKNFISNPTDSKGQRFLVRGDNAVPLSKDSKVLSITNMFVQTERNGAPDMVISAAHCIYNTTNSTFSSEGELSLRTADQRLSLQGRGFLFLQRESRLIVSNDVKTLVRWRSLAGQNGVARPPATVAGSGGNASSPTNASLETVQISSKQLDYRPEFALFEHQVRALETNGLLTSEKLAAHFISNRVVRIEAEQHVVVEQGKSKATGDRGTFTAEKETGVAHLNGHATWQDEQHSIAADTLILDRVRNLVRGEGQARMKLPRQSLSQPGSLFAMSATSRSVPSQTNQFVELSSDLLKLQLPATNGPVQRIEAEGNVTILSAADHSRATGQKAVYDENAGVLELTGNPILQGEDHLVKGDSLVFNRTNRVLSARPNAYVRVPVLALGNSPLVARDQAVQKSTGAATNQFIEAFADDFEYHTNRMDFHRNVRAHLLEGEVKRGDLECRDFLINFGQRLESILARGGVTARQFPSPLLDHKAVSKKLSCETLTARMNADGRLEVLLAEGHVQGEQTVSPTNKARATLTKIAAEQLKARFAEHTNQVETIVAERDVKIEQEGRTAHGDHAVFGGDSRLVELTGQPTAISPEGRITQAEVLIWDSTRQQLRVRGQFKSEWQRFRERSTGDSGLRSAKSP